MSYRTGRSPGFRISIHYKIDDCFAFPAKLPVAQYSLSAYGRGGGSAHLNNKSATDSLFTYCNRHQYFTLLSSRRLNCQVIETGKKTPDIKLRAHFNDDISNGFFFSLFFRDFSLSGVC